MILLIQGLIAKSFMGGTSQDLSSFYTNLTRHSSVCSDGVFKANGPLRFRKDKNEFLDADSSLYTIFHNRVLIEETPKQSGEPLETRFVAVDSIASQVYHLSMVGIESEPVKLDLRNSSSGSISLPEKISPTGTITIDQKTKLLLGKTSDSVSNLVNMGLSKPLTYPKLFDKMRYSCVLVNCSESDFLTAIGQLIDCKLKAKPESYEFEPDVPRIRAKILNTFRMFGTESETEIGIKQKIIYHAFELASEDTIRDAITNQSCFRRFRIQNDPNFMKDIEQLKSLAMSRFLASGDKPPREFKPKSEPLLVYGYGFSISVQVELVDGRMWMI